MHPTRPAPCLIPKVPQYMSRLRRIRARSRIQSNTLRHPVLHLPLRQPESTQERILRSQLDYPLLEAEGVLVVVENDGDADGVAGDAEDGVEEVLVGEAAVEALCGEKSERIRR